MGKTVYVLVGFVLFVLFCIVLHCLLTKKEHKRINDNVMSDILSTISRKGTVVTVKRQYYDNDDDDNRGVNYSFEGRTGFLIFWYY